MTATVIHPALRDRVFAEGEPVGLTICCITFNHAAFIRQCLDGFLDQRCGFRVEVVIYDDASTDGTAQIIRDYALRHPSVFRTILMTENQYSKGVNPYFAYVFPAARGQYLAICDGDDFWSDPDKLSRQVDVLDAHPQVALVYGPVRGVDEAGNDVAHKGGIRRDLSADELKLGPPINTLTTCFRNIFGQVPVSLYVRTATVGDIMVWAMLGYHGSARFMPELAAASYRQRAGGLMSMQSRNRQTLMTAVARMHIAAYHAETGDAVAFDGAMLGMAAAYNGGLPGAVHYKTAVRAPLPLRLVRLRKSFTLWRKSLLRNLRGQ